MKIVRDSLLIVLLLLMIAGCNLTKEESNNKNNINDKQDNKNELSNSNEVIKTMKAIINEKEYIVNLEDNVTSQSFVNSLPQELDMSELNGNEKYVYLNSSLPTNSYNPQTINAGDVMLYGDNCLVIFYKSFDTSYSYTKIGHIDNLQDLDDGNITVKFEK